MTDEEQRQVMLSTLRRLAAEASPNEEFGIDAIEFLLSEIDRLRGLLQTAADEREGAVSSHCCLNCPWCDGEAPIGKRFEHAADCPAFTPDGAVK